LSGSTLYLLFSTLYSPEANGLTAAGSPGILFEVVGIKQLLGSLATGLSRRAVAVHNARMIVFVYEYVCGGGNLGREFAGTFTREGWAMLSSVVADFAAIDGCEVWTTLDSRFSDRSLAAQRIHRIDPTVAEPRVIAELAAAADWSLVIAPETDGILFDRVRCVEEAGGRLLGPSSSAVALTADKLECARRLVECGVPAVTGTTIQPQAGWRSRTDLRYPVVLKPRDGAGSDTTIVFRESESLESMMEALYEDSPEREFLLQPYVPGVPVSVSFLVGDAGIVPLLAGEQLFLDKVFFRYIGGRMPLAPALAKRALALGARAIAAVPGLRGYVGVDLVLGPSDERGEGASDTVIEINPRITTSYVGLRAMAVGNLASYQLRVVADDVCDAIEWRDQSIRFYAFGRVRYETADPHEPSQRSVGATRSG
jgi:predicted ATP-grasp superfamily ATP-dependent carboligase